MPILLLSLLLGLLGLGDFCQAAVFIEVKSAKEIAEDDPRVASTMRRLEKYQKSVSKPKKGSPIVFFASGWIEGVTPQEKRMVLAGLQTIWGKGNVEIVEPTLPGKPRLVSRPPPKAMAKMQKGLSVRGAAASSSPRKFFDHDGSRGGSAGAGPVLADGEGTAKKAAFTVQKTVPVKDLNVKSVPDPRHKEKIERVSGIIGNEIGSFRETLKDPKGPRNPSNYDPKSKKKLQTARVGIAWISFKVLPSKVAPATPPSEEEKKNPVVLENWKKGLDAAALALHPPKNINTLDSETAKMLKVLESHEKTKKKCRHFVYWPVADKNAKKKVPAKWPARMHADWPYDEADKIAHVMGPFRNPVKVYDVPASDDVYIYFYCGVR